VCPPGQLNILNVTLTVVLLLFFIQWFCLNVVNVLNVLCAKGSVLWLLYINYLITCTLYLCLLTWTMSFSIKHLIGTSLEFCSSITQTAIDALTSNTLSASFFNLYNNTAILWNILTEKCPDWELSDPAKQVTEKCPALKINELRIVRPRKFH